MEILPEGPSIADELATMLEDVLLYYDGPKRNYEDARAPSPNTRSRSNEHCK